VAPVYGGARLSYKCPIGAVAMVVRPASLGNRTMTEVAPVIGNWYKHENGEIFEIVAMDADDGAIEIQYFDGTIEEIEVDAWEQMEIEEAEPPEDWSGSVDVDDDEVEELQDLPTENFDDPLEYLDRQE
jgi:hypothetical protein